MNDETEQAKDDETGKEVKTVKAAPPALKAGGTISAIIPTTPDEAWRLAIAICEAGMVPDSYSKNQDDRQTQARVMIGIMKGMEIGIPPITALSTIVIINNRPCVWGDGAIALVQKSGNLENFKETMTGTPHEDDWTATCEVQRKGLIDPIIREFTWAQAKKASLTGKKGPWMSYPARMMQMRARAFALRDGFADALYGLGIGEEMRDVPVAKETVDTDFLSDEAPVLPKLEPAMEEMPDDVRETVEAGLDSSVNSNEGEE